jgi:hypothetical protein
MLLACIVISSAITYAVITIPVHIANHITILGGTLDLWLKGTGENYTNEYTTNDFGGQSVTGVVIESPLLVLVSSAANTVSFALTYSNTLPSNVGTIVWQVELSFGSPISPYTWHWVDWTENQINVGQGQDKFVYLPGTIHNPMSPGTKLGLEPSAVPTDSGLTGHFRYVLSVSPTAPCGDYPFGMTITGTQT